MPTPWLKRIRDTGQLSVFNKAASWAVPVAAAVRSFNALNLGVTLVDAAEEKAANIVVLLATAPMEYNYYGDKTKTRDDFKFDGLHGQASTLTDVRRNEIFFAAVFLPGKVKKATNTQKEIVVVHEFIHACGLDGREDHDVVGIMASPMTPDGGGLIETLPEKGAVAMPPIRVGGKTVCKMKMLWAGGPACSSP